jgi:hypothetical protein
VCTLASATAFANFPPLAFCSTNTHFIITVPNNSSLLKVAALLFEKYPRVLPNIIFFGLQCLNLTQAQAFISLREILSNPSTC